MRALTVLLLAACGRVGFAPSPSAHDAGDDGDGLASDGVAPVTAFRLELAAASPSSFHRIAELPDGAFAVAGYYSAATMLGTTPLANAGGEDALVAVIERDGSVRWAKGFGSTGDDEVRGLAVSADGTIYITGVFGAAIGFGGAVFVPVGQHDAFLASFTPGGAHRWSRAFGSTGDEHGSTAVAIGGDVVAAGTVTGVIDFGDGNPTMPSAATDEAFVARWSGADGTLRWARRFGNSGVNSFQGLATDPAGNIYASGSYQGTPSFGGPAVATYGSHDAVILSLAGTGSYRWDRTFGGADAERARVVAVGSGVVLAGGYYNLTTNLAIPASNQGDAVLAAYATDGTPLWAHGFGGPACDQIEAIVATTAGFRVGGRFNGTVDLGTGPLTASVAADAIAFTISPSGAISDAITFGDVDDDAISGIASPVLVGYDHGRGVGATCIGADTTGVGRLTAGNAFIATP